MTVIALALLLFWLVVSFDLIRGILFDIPNLQARDFVRAKTTPKVSILFSARNEQKRIPEALASMLAMDYPDFEVIAINDRSSDKTLQEMEKFTNNPRLKIISISELPEGWLGKNHALQKGYEISKGEWLLFTDADVSFHPKALQAALGFCEKNGADHLPLFPQMIVRGFWPSVYARCFSFGFLVRFRPWQASNPKAKNYVGIGAFNLVRRAAYERIGMHASFRLNVLDDMELGRRMKAAGFRQFPAATRDCVRVPWMEPGWQGILKSIEKNAFAGMGYRFSLLVMMTLFSVMINMVPYFGAFFWTGTAQLLMILSLGLIFCCYLAIQKQNSASFWVFFFHPLGVLLVLVMLWRSAILALRRGGIQWRDTFYKLSDLKQSL